MSEVEDTLVQTPDNGNAALAAAIVSAVQESQGPKKIGMARYLRERSVHRGKPHLTRKCFQNGIQLDEMQLTRDAIEMLNAIEPGVYNEGRLKVLAAQDGNAMSGIDIQYSNKSVDERMQMKTFYPTFEHMLAAILKERRAA